MYDDGSGTGVQEPSTYVSRGQAVADMSPSLLIAVASTRVQPLPELSSRVAKSCIPPLLVQMNAWNGIPPLSSDSPTTWPRSLIPSAMLDGCQRGAPNLERATRCPEYRLVVEFRPFRSLAISNDNALLFIAVAAAPA